MLEARSVAVVGASARPGSFGDRVVTELLRSPSEPEIHLVNPRYAEIGGRPCLPSLDDVPVPVDLVLFCVPDAALETEVDRAAERGDGAGVIYGSVVDADGSLRRRIAETARGAGMELCGGGCMGFVNRVHGLRAIGYLEEHPLREGPIALVTHSGSAFSALLRADRRLGWTLAVSSGQELVTTTSSYLDYALSLPETEIVGLLLETLRDPGALRAALDRCNRRGIPVVILTVGASPGGRAMVAAHSGALAGDDATWEALCDAHGLLRVRDLDEMANTLELLAAGRRPLRPGGRRSEGAGIAAVHDSGAERALVVDVADAVGLPFARIAPETHQRLAALLDPGLEPGNPLDVWGTGAETRELFGGCLSALAADDAVEAVALAVDLVPEFDDDDDAYRLAAMDAFAATTKPVCLITNLACGLDRPKASLLREAGIPVLEGTRSGLLALRHLLDLADRGGESPVAPPVRDEARRRRWQERLASREPLDGAGSLALLADYGLAVAPHAAVSSAAEAGEAAEALGWPVVLKTDDPAIAHKSDVGGVVLGLDSRAAVTEAYEKMAARLGPRALLMATAPAGVELALGMVRDPLLGPVVVVGAGGVLVEVLADRAVALPPLDAGAAHRLLRRLAARRLLEGVRGAAPADLDAVAAAVVALSDLAGELGDVLEALDVNPLRCGPGGAVALDALVVAR